MACIRRPVVLRRNVYVPVQMNVITVIKSSHSVMDNYISADTEGHLPGETP